VYGAQYTHITLHIGSEPETRYEENIQTTGDSKQRVIRTTPPRTKLKSGVILTVIHISRGFKGKGKKGEVVPVL
jgi:hypothetical protein